ncbi:MAG: calcium/sodium antiporter [Bacteroidota bacterium]
MVLPIILLLVGFAILIKGADFLVNGASSAAKKYGVSNLAIGLTVVAFGTSMPELIVSLVSALDGKNDASFGNVIGSNNFNLLFILGIAGLIYPLVVHRNTVKYEVPLSFLAAGILFIVVNDTLLWGATTFTAPYGGILDRLDSIILLVFFAGFLYYIYRTMKNASEVEEGDAIKIFSTPVATAMIIGGLLMLILGGQIVVDNALKIAHHYGLSEKLIGLTILAAGTSLPELATSCVAAYRKNTDIAIGNVVGSNIFNIFFILGITGIIHPIQYNIAMNFDIYVLLASTVLLTIFMFTLSTRKLDRWEAFLMLCAYFAYTIFLIGME